MPFDFPVPRGQQRPMWSYWGVRRRDNPYLSALAEQWQREHDNFHFVPVLSESDPRDAWQGRHGLVHEAMLTDFPDMRGYEIHVCGSVKMVEAAVPAFISQGLDENFCFSDAFVPSARSEPMSTSCTAMRWRGKRPSCSRYRAEK